MGFLFGIPCQNANWHFICSTIVLGHVTTRMFAGKKTMQPIISALLVIELGETTRHQRKILCNELHKKHWRDLQGDGRAFTMQIRGARSDLQILDRATQNLHDAVEAALISDWSADCFLSETSDGPLTQKRGNAGAFTRRR
jgi:hypothetical protein